MATENTTVEDLHQTEAAGTPGLTTGPGEFARPRRSRCVGGAAGERSWRK